MPGARNTTSCLGVLNGCLELSCLAGTLSTSVDLDPVVSVLSIPLPTAKRQPAHEAERFGPHRRIEGNRGGGIGEIAGTTTNPRLVVLGGPRSFVGVERLDQEIAVVGDIIVSHPKIAIQELGYLHAHKARWQSNRSQITFQGELSHSQKHETEVSPDPQTTLTEGISATYWLLLAIHERHNEPLLSLAEL